VELEDRVELRFRAGERRAGRDLRRRPRLAAALADPDAGAVRIDCDRAGRTPGAAFGELAPVFDGLVRGGEGVGGCCLGGGEIATREKRDETKRKTVSLHVDALKVSPHPEEHAKRASRRARALARSVRPWFETPTDACASIGSSP